MPASLRVTLALRQRGYTRAMPNFAPSAWARRASLALHAVLLVALPATGGVLGLVAALPLLLPLRGLWAGRLYTYGWASLLLVFYAGGFLAESYAQPARGGVAMALAGVAAFEFWTLVFYIRLRAVERRRDPG